MRYREDKPEYLPRAQEAVAQWRQDNPEGTAEQMLAAIGDQFLPAYGVVLRGVLSAIDRSAPQNSVTAILRQLN